MNAQLVPHNEVPRQQLPTVTTPSHLLAMAVEQGADLDKLTKLMDLQERWESGEARKAFTVAMTGFKSEPMEILKKKNVSFSGTSYNHAELSDITEAIGPALSKHSLSYRWDIRQDSANSITVDCILTHISGHSERVTMSAPPDDSGKNNKIQQIASSTTYLQRYTLLAVTGMSTKGMDDDGRGTEPDAGNSNDAGVIEDWKAAFRDAKTADDLEGYRAQVAGLQGNIRQPVVALFKARQQELKA